MIFVHLKSLIILLQWRTGGDPETGGVVRLASESRLKLSKIMKFPKKSGSLFSKGGFFRKNQLFSLFSVVLEIYSLGGVPSCFAGTVLKVGKERLQSSVGGTSKQEESGPSSKKKEVSRSTCKKTANESKLGGEAAAFNGDVRENNPELNGSKNGGKEESNKNITFKNDKDPRSGRVSGTSRKSKCSLMIPEAIRKSVPEDMQYIVLLQMILNLIRSEYVNELEEGESVEKTIAGLLSSLDPHSSYLNEKAFTALKNQTDGEFGGLGIEIMMDESFVRIISPIDDTPAYKAGLKSGDLIIYIDDECVNGVSAEEVLEKLRGKPGTKVKLKIKRSDKVPFDVVIERALIKIQSVKTEILDNIGYIRVSTFDKHTTQSIKKFLSDNKDKKLHGIILDMRNNPGGLLDECVSASDIFLDGGKIVSTRGRTKENTLEFDATPGDMSNGMPIVVLINSGTASAPEIMAGALRDNKRAIIVGTRSFGKGSVQKVIPLSDKTAIKITVAKHFTPSGECIQANGITPDIEVEWAEIKKSESLFVVREEFFANALDAEKRKLNKRKSDEENRKALDALAARNRKEKEGGMPGDIKGETEEDFEVRYRKMSLKERVERDFQLNKAFDVLKTIAKVRTIDAEIARRVEAATKKLARNRDGVRMVKKERGAVHGASVRVKTIVPKK